MKALLASVRVPARRLPLPVGVAAAEARRDRRAAVAQLLVSPWLHAALLGIGVLLRVARYAAERSLWLDESYLALNLTRRSYGEMLGTLDFGQGGPAGFLLGERLAVDLFGDGEHALRLLPFLAGLASLFLFYAVARRMLTPVAVPFALFLFAAGTPFVFYSVTVKQYSLDVAVALGMFYLFLRVVSRPLTRSRLVFMTAAGAAAVWLSHPAAFVLAGVGAGLVASLLLRGERRRLLLLAGPFAAWLVSFGTMFLLTLRDYGQLAQAASGFTSIFGSPQRNLYMIFRDVNLDFLHWTADGLAPALALVGAAAMWSAPQKRPWVIAVVTMVAATLAAGYLGKYAVGQRFILFLLPFALLALCEGAARLIKVLPRDLAVAVTVVVAAIVLVPPTAMAARNLARPAKQQDIRPIVAYLGERWQPGDALYVSYITQYALRYYLECSGCGGVIEPRLRAALQVQPRNGAAQSTPALISQSPDVVIGRWRHPWDIDAFGGRPRVWVLFSTPYPFTQDIILRPVEAAGRQLQCSPLRRGKAFVCLYDLSRPTAPRSSGRGRVPF